MLVYAVIVLTPLNSSNKVEQTSYHCNLLYYTLPLHLSNISRAVMAIHVLVSFWLSLFDCLWLGRGEMTGYAGVTTSCLIADSSEGCSTLAGSSDTKEDNS